MSKRQQGRKPETGDLQGTDRVAALLLVMGKPLADRIIRLFEDREIRALARSATTLPAIGYDKVDKLVDDLVGELEACVGVIGSTEDAQGLLAGVVSEEEVTEIMGALAGQPPKRIWSRLASVADEKLAAFIAAEQPQVAVFVLSNLAVEKASAVMEKLNAGLRSDLSSRLVSMRPISDVAARLVADRLAQELLGETEVASRPNNHARLGAILNQLERDQASDILARLHASDPEDAKKVLEYVFAFEDVSRLSPEDRGRLLEDVPSERLVLALRDADAGLTAQVLAGLTPRSRRLVEAELANNVKAPKKAVSEARRSIAGLALALAEKGQISLAGRAGDAVAEQSP